MYQRRKKYNVFTRSLALLLYLVSIFPTILLHQHDRPIVAYQNATACEKTIYYRGHASEKCHHDKHISSANLKCKNCDHFSQKIYTNDLGTQGTIASHYLLNGCADLIEFRSYTSQPTSNKGPPLV